MEIIVSMIDEVLTHADQPVVIEKVRLAVQTMMERFPLYPNLS
jgi:glycine/serine hydroxymethyltransferase